jgi:hypothetical protein
MTYTNINIKPSIHSNPCWTGGVISVTGRLDIQEGEGRCRVRNIFLCQLYDMSASSCLCAFRVITVTGRLGTRVLTALKYCFPVHSVVLKYLA